MRKVYHNEKSPLGLAMSIIVSVGLTAILFGALPFAHRIAQPDGGIELIKTSTADLPPPVEEEETAPPPEAEKPPEPPPEPQLVDTPQQIPLSANLELVMGKGGGLVGYGEDMRALTAATTVQEEAFDVTDLEKRPEAVSQTPPTYPAELKKAKIEGVVTLVFVLGEDGRVEDPRVENSSRPEFEKPALEAIRKWRFRPGEKDGQPVRTYIRQAMRFRAPAG